MSDSLRLIEGGLAVDDRGTVTFANDFDFKGVKRFYVVQNHKRGFIRAWHGHKIEAKYVFVVKGTAIIGVANMADGTATRYIMSEKKPQVLYIPPGHYNGFRTLTDDTQIIFFSTATVAASKNDDYREPYDKWYVWDSIES